MRVIDMVWRNDLNYRDRMAPASGNFGNSAFKRTLEGRYHLTAIESAVPRRFQSRHPNTLGFAVQPAFVRTVRVYRLIQRLAVSDPLLFPLEKGQARFGRRLKLLRFGVRYRFVCSSRFDCQVEKVEERRRYSGQPAFAKG